MEAIEGKATEIIVELKKLLLIDFKRRPLACVKCDTEMVRTAKPFIVEIVFK